MKSVLSKHKSDPSGWKRPDEVLKLHRIKQKQKALQQRFNKPQDSTSKLQDKTNEKVAGKRKNPFAKEQESSKRRKSSLDLDDEINTQDTIFELLSVPETKGGVKNIEAINEECSNIQAAIDDVQYGDETEEEEKLNPTPHLPIDWSIKSKLRVLCRTAIPGNNLKTNQEASGLTSFVRCINSENSSTTGLDISPGAKFHQSTLYWQFPHLPWLTMYPRNAKANHGFNLGENESKALQRDWIESFRSLFQLVRSRQCPYFYVCANSFTVLFRAAGIGGRVETHAFLTPTSRGLRASLRHDDIEFTMPLKKNPNETINDINSSIDSRSPNTSLSNTSNDTLQEKDNESSDEDIETFLENLGVEADQIKKINEKHSRKIQNLECEDDFSEQSLVYIEGVDCQAFFNFLLNTKSAISKVGRLSNIPPTLLAPVAFQGASLRNVSLRASKVRLDGEDYSSMELKGVILPHILPYLSNLLSGIKDCFSATLTSFPSTNGFTRASIRLLEDTDKENQQVKTADHVFGRENLSDCGIPVYIVEAMCKTNPQSIHSLERISYVKEQGGFLY